MYFIFYFHLLFTVFTYGKIETSHGWAIIEADMCMETDFGNLIPYNYIFLDAWKL